MSNFQDLIAEAHAERAAVKQQLDQAHSRQRSRTALESVIDAAMRAAPGHAHYAAGNNDVPNGWIPGKAASAITLDLRTFAAPDIQDNARAHRSLVPLTTDTPLSASIFKHSLAAQAGAQVIIIKDAPAVQSGDVIAFYRQADEFIVVDPSVFGPVPDGDDVAVSPHPFKRASIALGESANQAVSFKLTRRDLKDSGFDIQGALIHSIMQGVARAGDAAVLAAINAIAPTAFTLAAAAARGLQFNELRALVGTSAIGAEVGADGVLRAAGIQAELTSSMTQTLVGSFSRAAIAVHPEVRILAERMNTVGDLNLVVWLNVEGICGDSNAFWTVGA